MTAGTSIRRYEARARSTDTFGRVLCDCRDQHFVVDGPVWNGCPGEAVTPGELFLAAVASCGVELLQVLAREEEVALRSVDVAIAGELDPANPVHSDVTVFGSVRLDFALAGPSKQEADRLVKRFKGR
jgi:organic hydroperoxide reductase OsmC/OhrA